MRRSVITDDEARRFYLAGGRFDAILRGEDDGFAGAPA